jgi:2-oxoglutarate ferredoxin oxidoreductase subunit alpha
MDTGNYDENIRKLGGMIRANTGYKADAAYLKYDSRPFVPSAILKRMREVLA